MTTLPLWAVITLGAGSPIAAFLAALLGTQVARRGQRETETRSRREHVLASLRWATELAIQPDPGKAAIGFAHLKALAKSNLSDADVQKLVNSALGAVVAEVASRVTLSESTATAATIREDKPAPNTGNTPARPVESTPAQQTGGDSR